MSQQERIQSEIRAQASNMRAKRAARTLMGNMFTDSFPLRLRCECGQFHCDDVVEVPSELGWSSQSMQPLFVVAPDHEQTDIETVVEKTADYYVVRKDLPTLA